MPSSVRNLNRKVFATFKAEAIREGMTVGEALTAAMDEWLKGKRKTAKIRRDFRRFKPRTWGATSGRTSSEIDEILYGDRHRRAHRH